MKTLSSLRVAGRWLALSAVLLVGCPSHHGSGAPPYLTSGHAWLMSDRGNTLTLQRDGRTLLTFHPESFQVGSVDSVDTSDSCDPYSLYGANAATPAGLTWRSASAMDVTSDASSLTVKLSFQGGSAQVVFSAPAAERLKAVFTGTTTDGQPIAFFRVRTDADATEAFYGLGEWGDTVNQRGKLRPMQMEVDASKEGGTDENHAPVPLLIGTKGWGLFVESKRPGSFGVAQESNTLIEVTYGTGQDSGAGLTFHLFTADHPLDIQKHYYDVTGYPGLPAPWAYGPLIWRNDNRQDAQAQTLEDIEHIRGLHLATSGIWFDRPYATGVETFDFHPDRYPDPVAMFRALHDAGLRYGVWHAPYCAPATNGDPAPANLAYATDHGYFPPLVGGSFNKWGPPIDFTNPDAYAWWQQNLHKYTDSLDSGGFEIEGFKLDYAEDVQLGIFGARLPWRFHDGSDELTMHYGYTLLYHKVYRETLDPNGAFLLTRTGRWGDQVRGMIIWPGDLDADFSKVEGRAVGGLPAALMKGLSLSASGFPFYASDTGGYRDGPAEEETMLRWIEANTISAVMQVGDATGITPWEYAGPDHYNDPQFLTDYAKYALLHMRLYPYAWTYAKQIASTGRPIVRPFGLVYPGLNKHPNDQFMFGDNVLSAPVVEKDSRTKHVILPPGSWYGWWDGQKHDAPATGAEIDVPADLHTLPLFMAANSIVPMLRENIDTLSPVKTNSTIESFANDAGVLAARVTPQGSGASGSGEQVPVQMASFTVYDGTELMRMGNSFSYQAGTVFNKGVLFEAIATAKPSGVLGGSAALAEQSSLDALKSASSGWFWNSDTGGTLWIKLASSGSAALQ